MIDRMCKLLFFLLLSISLHALHLKDENGKLIPSAKGFLELFDAPSHLTLDQLMPYLKMHWVRADTERWEMEPKFAEKRTAAFALLKEMGCIDSIYAKSTEYDYALILGAMEKAMQRRLNFLYEEWLRGVRFKEIVLLTGERDLDPQKEDYPADLKTESDLLVHLFNQHPLKDCAPHMLINAPKQLLKNGRFQRPNTASTILTWLEQSPKPGSCLAISTQPFVGYQEAILNFFLPFDFQIESIGPGSDSELSYFLPVYLDNFAKWLMYEHLTEFQCEKLSSKSLSHPPRGNGMDEVKTAYWSNRYSSNRCRA